MLLAALLLAATIDAKLSATPGVVMDGKVTQEEWASATRVPLTNGGHVVKIR